MYRSGENFMAYHLKTKIWQTGSLEWWGIIDGEDVFLGGREFPLPPEDGDRWIVRATGEAFCILDGEIRRAFDAPEPEKSP
jgi:hypothetical protein